MFVMLFGYPCFYVDQEAYGSETDDRIFKLISKGFNASTLPGFANHFPASIPASESAKDLIAKLLTMDTAKRLTAAEALDVSAIIARRMHFAPELARRCVCVVSLTRVWLVPRAHVFAWICAASAPLLSILG